MTVRNMTLIQTIDDLRSTLRPRRGDATIGLVPTMGALHAGHASLIQRARQECDLVVVSIFVNPTQFGPNEDFAKYPRNLQRDLESCAEHGVDVVFAPTGEQMYPDRPLTSIHVAELTETLCGPLRPGHFDGVCLVVAKLLNIVQPDVAYFGQKDAQQVTVIRRMVDDLNIPVRIAVCPTVREADGLAMSSRNAYLDPAQRQKALCLHQALQAGREAIEAGNRTTGDINAIMRGVLDAAGVGIEYVEAVNAVTLAGEDMLAGRVLLVGAIRVGSTRLIDNLALDI